MPSLNLTPAISLAIGFASQPQPGFLGLFGHLEDHYFRGLQ
jgi:hypothetical protein